jgi:hypothetical protein
MRKLISHRNRLRLWWLKERLVAGGLRPILKRIVAYQNGMALAAGWRFDEEDWFWRPFDVERDARLLGGHPGAWSIGTGCHAFVDDETDRLFCRNGRQALALDRGEMI